MWSSLPHRPAGPVSALLYSIDFLILNPLFRPLPIPRQGFATGAFVICGALKSAVLVWAFRRVAPAARPLLWTLLALNLIIAASLGYSRWQTGLATVTSSRYQYIPLLCFGPPAGILLCELRTCPRLAIILLCACGLAFPWKRHADQWATERGTNLRTSIRQTGPNDRFDPSTLTAGRARELMNRYNLH
jgi:hypothetical protein